jgi:cyanophycin synthetase
VILKETEAINTGLDRAASGGLVVILPETVTRAISLIEARNPLPENINQRQVTDTQANVKSGSLIRYS